MKNLILTIFVTLISLSSFSQKTKVKSNEIFNKNTFEKIEKNESIKIDSISKIENKATQIKLKKNKKEYRVPQNGTTYIILSSTKTTYSDCYKCYNRDYTNYCPAKYEVQSRKYTKWKNGTIERVWNTTTKIFMGCGSWR
jgi:hypothetical protein